jgi:hypothetical protein
MKKDLNVLNWSIILLGIIVLFSDFGWHFVAEGPSNFQGDL